MEARRPSCGEAPVANPVNDSFGLATMSGCFASFTSSDAVGIETGNPSRSAAGDLGEEDVGDGDDE